ncbi:MAG TPA: ferritin-like domain-containing protein, partial [Candidatus Polarisedimenticolia bacterium]|nr:ferritin-like domain-containing protein [Candidatus Polarisedimenticolia bacterium]
MELRSLQDVFTHELKDMYNAEKQILKALPEMVKAAENSELKSALEEHRRITETQVDRLEQILTEMEESTRSSKKCKGMEGILEEGKELLKGNGKNAESNNTLDAALIGAAQKVEHYEIAAYGTLVAFAKQLGNDEAAQLLEETLGEEKEADEKLTEIASSINEESAEGEEGSMTGSSRGQSGS